MRVGRRRTIVVFSVLAWGAACTWGLLAIHAHQAEPGRGGRDGGHWPSTTGLSREPRGYTLLLFAHPRCPCLKASLQELARVVGLSGRPASGEAEGDAPPAVPVRVQIVAFVPGLAARRGDAGWSRALASLQEWTARIPACRVVVDPEGEEAARFGSATSGDVLVFNPSGQIVFRGGVTRGRGIEGECASSRKLMGILRRDPASVRGTPPSCRSLVYGCPILPRTQEPPGPN